MPRFTLLGVGVQMRRFAVFGLVLVSVVVVGVVMVSAAFAESTPLPLIHTALPGETYPIDIGGKVVSNAIQIQNTSGSLPMTLVSVLLEAKELSALGPAKITFTGVNEPKNKEKCETEGAGEGTVIVPDAEWHMVYTALSPGHVLETAGLILFSQFTLHCGALETVVTGPLMMRFSEVPGNSANGADSTEIESATHCTTKVGFAEISSYFTDSSIEVTKQLFSASISGGAEEFSCLEIPGTLLLTVEPVSLATMFTVLL
jgi:hypothetical protein